MRYFYNIIGLQGSKTPDGTVNAECNFYNIIGLQGSKTYEHYTLSATNKERKKET